MMIIMIMSIMTNEHRTINSIDLKYSDGPERAGTGRPVNTEHVVLDQVSFCSFWFFLLLYVYIVSTDRLWAASHGDDFDDRKATHNHMHMIVICLLLRPYACYYDHMIVQTGT